MCSARWDPASSPATATVARAAPAFEARPVIRLELDPDEEALISEIHEASDWVFTIDKSLGIEFFDHHPASRPSGVSLILDRLPTCRSLSGRLRSHHVSLADGDSGFSLNASCKDYDLGAYHNRTHALLGELRALSGRLALKLASTHRAEALGLALGKLFLEFQEVFR